MRTSQRAIDRAEAHLASFADPGSARWLTKQPGYMARPAESWLDGTVTVRRVLGLSAFWLLCIGLPVVLALAWLGPR